MKFLLFVLLTLIPQHPLFCLANSYFNNSLNYLSKTTSVAKTGCRDRCGDIIIPYPFGLTSSDSSCYYNEWYAIICNTTFNPPRLFLTRFNHLEVVEVALQLEDSNYPTQALVVKTMPQNVCSTGFVSSLDLQASPYRFFASGNMFVAHGCSGIVVQNRTGHVLAGCSPVCLNSSPIDEEELSRNSYFPCSSVTGCCFALFTNGVEDLDFYNITLEENEMAGSHGCNTRAILIDSSDLTNIYQRRDRATILQWKAVDELLDYGDYANFTCDSNRGACLCKPPYIGNPYLPYGCQVDCSVYGSYQQCKTHQLLKLATALGLGIGIGLVLLLLSAYWLYKYMRRTMKIRQKSKCFKRNGGLLLQQQISSTLGVVDKTKIFTLTELEKATHNFNENRILGQGGQGTVYKGMMEDGKIVAIKKSKKVNEDQLEKFINEVIIVSQINHRNVVKLLGCCLETEVPLLVYEFIPNGTLYHHIHDPSDDFQLTWKMRLQIAAESACALAYLHSSTSPPIYHRDIKSSNILLDDKYKAKVSDFGISKAITIDQTHVTTSIQGTYGYLDPEYFQSNRFTEKSDVYSFGVVLVELITGIKPVFPTESGRWVGLASEFLNNMESCTLDDILNTSFEESKKGEFVAVANIARQCLNMNGKRRPTMKEVAKMLDEIRSPNQKNSTEPDYIETNEVISKMNEKLYMSFPDIEMASYLSVEVQPLMVNTF